MGDPRTENRGGMTLVELLVVIAILGLLSVVVLPSLSDGINSRRYREAARNVSAFIARSQSRAIGAATPRGVLIQPLAADPAAAIDVFFANTPDVYSGELGTSTATIQGVTNVTPGPLTMTFDPMTTSKIAAQPDFLVAGDAIQFGGRGPRFKLLPPNQLTMWMEDNQSPRNTAWPRATGAGLPFKIYRQPTRAPGGVFQVQGGASIDLAWSCLGTRPFSNFILPGMTDKSITILFDASGKPLELVHSGGVRTTIGEPIFLLIGESDLSGNDYNPAVAGDNTSIQPEKRQGANWQYGDCVWLCIDNNSGVVKFGMVAPRAKTVYESQAYVRMTVALGAGER